MPLVEPLAPNRVRNAFEVQAAGTILKILVPAGETVTAGTVLAVIGEPGDGEWKLTTFSPDIATVRGPASLVIHRAAAGFSRS